jgi:large subunit ribosomal protein L31
LDYLLCAPEENRRNQEAQFFELVLDQTFRKGDLTMKKNIHPVSQKTVFQDVSTGTTFLVDSTIETGESVVWPDGNTYPLVKVEISSASHSAFNEEAIEASESTQAEKFRARYERSTRH